MKRIQREEIYRSRIFTVCRDTLETEAGKEIVRDVVVHPGAVVVLAEEAGRLLFVRQYRHAAEQHLLELVAGTLEPGEAPEVTAMRELQEEAGFKAKRMTRLATFYSSPGFCTQLHHLYLAEDLMPSRLPADDDEEIETVWIDRAEAIEMAIDGQIQDGKSLVGVLLYARHTQGL